MTDQHKQPFELLPWHQTNWQRLQAARQESRLPHAMLFSGASGLGKEAFALGFAQSMLCSEPTDQGMPCEHCKRCHLVQAGTHADLTVLTPDPESKSQDIKIDVVRQLVEKSTMTAQFEGYKVIIISPAEQMNRSAANSLLKTLEEPVKNTLLILITSRLNRLLPTIRSRCQQINFALPDDLVSTHWLEKWELENEVPLLLRLSGGAPLAALELDKSGLLSQRGAVFDAFLSLMKHKSDPVKLAADWQTIELSTLLSWVAGWLSDIIRLKENQQQPYLANPDKLQDLKHLAEYLDCKSLHRILLQVYAAKRNQGSTLNPQLLLEDLLISCARRVA